MKIQRNSGAFPPASKSKGVTEIKCKELELPSHSHFINEECTSLHNDSIYINEDAIKTRQGLCKNH